MYIYNNQKTYVRSYFKMGLFPTTVALVVQISLAVALTNGFYIRNSANNRSLKIAANTIDEDDEWSVFKQKLGLSNKKVELLKSQKDRERTIELLNRFIEENPNYTVEKLETEENKPDNNFEQFYHYLLDQIKLSRRTLKTSVNFVLTDKAEKNLKRSRRKIAVKMVSDIPSDKIDEFLKMFNEKHRISNLDLEDDIDSTDIGNDYNGLSASHPFTMDHDYMYENLYDDEGDLATSANSNRNSQYGSFQDLILQASRNQWQRAIEETKLRSRDSEHFI